MPRTRLTVETVRGGKIRYKKQYKGQRWKSQVYHAETRDNEREAWATFCGWRETRKQQFETQDAEVETEATKIRRQIAEFSAENLAVLRRFHELTEDSEKVAAFKRLEAEVNDHKTENLQEIFSTVRQLINENPTAFSTASLLFQNIDKDKTNIEPQFETEKLIEQWLGFRLFDVQAGGITAGTLDNNRHQLQRFVDFCQDIRDANEICFLKFRSHLQQKIAEGGSAYSQRDTLATVKNFLEWCSDTAKVIPPITNLRKRGTGIKISKKRAITTWDDAAITDLLSLVEGQQKLFYLLVLNCGAYESDIGTWTKIAVDDWGKEFRTFDKRKSTLTFKRHKEKDQLNVPTVTYKLWPITDELLTRFESTHSTLLLTTKKGSRLWIDELKENTSKKTKRKRKNIIGRQFGRLKQKHDQFGTLDDLRKPAVSKLDEHGEFARYAQYFAGHAPQSTTDRFYRKPNQKQFDAAVTWLGKQFGLLE